jgi:carboxylesterase type B
MALWGQSAGARAVVAYSYANPDDPIVTGLIADSGSASPTPLLNGTSFSTMAASFGCGNLTAAAELSCMQAVDALAIQKYVLNYSEGALGGPVADNVTAFANNTQRLVEGRIAKVVRLAGFVVLRFIEADMSHSL